MNSLFHKLGLLVLFCTASLTQVNAATVLITNATFDGSTNAIVSSSGTLLNNTYVGVGYFEGLTDSQIQAMDLSTFAQIATGGAFQEFDSSTSWWAFGAGVVDGNAQEAILAGSEFIGESIYSIIGNGATLATSTEFLIVKYSAMFGEDNPAFNAVAKIDLSGGNGTVLWGGSGVHSGNYFGEGVNPAYSTAGTAAVPEPSRLLFLALGLMGLSLRRKRA